MLYGEKIAGTQGYFLYKDSWRSYNPESIATVEISVYYDLFYEFLAKETTKMEYLGERNGFTVSVPTKESKYYKYRLPSITCTTFVSDWLYYSIDPKSKNKLKDKGKDLKKITLPSKLYEYLTS